MEYSRGSNCRLGREYLANSAKRHRDVQLSSFIPARAQKVLSSPQRFAPRRNSCNSAARKRPKLLQCDHYHLHGIFTASVASDLCAAARTERTYSVRRATALDFAVVQQDAGPDSYRSTLVYH